jgi:hypothetical protein
LKLINNNVKTLGIFFIVAGIVGAGYLFYTQIQGIPLARAEKISENYLKTLGSQDLEISEIMEFENNFYVIYSEHEAGMGAFEMLIDKNTGQIFPEYGPNMMWNLKHGHGGMMTGPGGMMGGFGGMMNNQEGMMGGYIPPGFEGELITEEKALDLAQEFLDQVYPGAEADDPHPFYGYYTIHTKRKGMIFGMLSVNAFDGSVWYHNWHGEYIQSIEMH